MNYNEETREELLEKLKKFYEELAEIVSAVVEKIEMFLEPYADLFKNIEFTEPTKKHEPCLKIGEKRPAPIYFKPWQKNKALFRPYKRSL